MCNAQNHDPGCMCGFGPPYLSSSDPRPRGKEGSGDGFTSVIRWRKRKKWPAKSILGKNKFLSALSQLGVNPKWIKSIARKYEEAGFQLSKTEWDAMSEGQQNGAERRLLQYLGLKEELVANEKDINLEITLFRLQPPRTHNSKVSYEESLSRTGSWSIFLEVIGFGLGADLALRIEAGGKIETSEDDCKIIAIPVCIKRRLVNLKFGNIYIAREKLIAEAGNKKTGQLFSRSIRSCKEYIPPSPGAPMLAEYNLSGDLTNLNTEFYIGWGSGKTWRAKFNLPVPGITPGIGVKIELERELMLTFDLAPRYDYKLYPTLGEMGISWKVDKGQAMPESV